MAQTKDQFMAKVQEMVSELPEFIMERAEKAWNSGAFDPEKYEDNYLLPKIFMSAMGEEIKWQFKPLDKNSLKERDNLIHFL